MMETNPLPLPERAESLAGLSDAALEPALKAFHTAADHQAYDPSTPDSDYGAVLLEAAADRCPEPERKQRLYVEARQRAATFASYATAGGEGLVRMMDVERINRKLNGLSDAQQE